MIFDGVTRAWRGVTVRSRSAPPIRKSRKDAGSHVLFHFRGKCQESPEVQARGRVFVRVRWCRVFLGGAWRDDQRGAKRLKGTGPRSSALTSMNSSWWRRRELNPRPEALRERPLHAQPLLSSRPAASRRGKTAAGQPRIDFAAPSGEPEPLHPNFATSAEARRVRYTANEAT